jgi:sortase A
MMTDSLIKPGLHSYNVRRRTAADPARTSVVSRVRSLLLVIGLVCVGYYAYTLANQQIYQSYENWAFDHRIAQPAKVSSSPIPAEGTVIGRVSVDRLNLSAMVRQGVSAKTLSEAVGHVPSTALPGQAGNFAIAAHRDTLFRALKDIRIGDVVTFQSETGLYHYQVVATQIVKPTDVSVLRADGGGLIQQPGNLLTMITCYPFYYVGSAPKRFIVEARLVNSGPSS